MLEEKSLRQIIADIPWDFDPRNKGSIARVWKKLNRRRAAALANPLRAGIEFSVNLECPIVERERPILSLARTQEPCRLVLRTPLQTGVDFWSQVWIVSVHSSSSEPTEFPSETAEELAVVEIIQPSMLKIVHPDFPGDVYGYTPPQHVATREHLVYRQLEKAQGSAVPYYYGMTQATMPNGESALMHHHYLLPLTGSSDLAKNGIFCLQRLLLAPRIDMRAIERRNFLYRGLKPCILDQTRWSQADSNRWRLSPHLCTHSRHSQVLRSDIFPRREE